MWCLSVKWYLIPLYKQTDRKTVPTNTWKPWKPVAKKKVDPYIPSLILKGASIYSNSCSVVNITPKHTVKDKLAIKSNLSLPIKA
jgi:hypothetical protein